MNRLNTKVYTIKKNMNKLLLTTLMIYLANLSYGHNFEKTVSNEQKKVALKKAALKEATIYTSGVQLRSSLSYNATPGLNEIIIEGISPSIQ